jgi:hypothetical protein
MSGSDYTTTPNLNLYKPIFNADVGNWGAHWNSNADTLDSALGTGAGGMFLPLAGGTLTGALTVGGQTAYGKVEVTPYNQYTAMAGGTQTESDIAIATDGGTGVFTNIRMQSNTYTAPETHIWGFLSTVNFAGTGGHGSHVGIYGQGFRSNAITNPTTTVATTVSGTTNTVAIADVTNFQFDGQPITIHGTPYTQVSHTGTSGSGTISTLYNIAVADGTAGNTVTANNNPSVWAGCFETRDLTGQPSANTSYALSVEFDLACNGADNGGYMQWGSPIGVRQILSLNGWTQGTGTPGEIGTAITIYGDANTTFKTGIRFVSAFNQAGVDFRMAVQGASANAIWLKAGQYVAFDNAGTNGAAANVRLSGDGTSLNIAGPVVATSTITVGTSTGATSAVLLDSAAGNNRTLWFQTAGLSRWYLYASSTAEGGSNAGSDFIVQNCNDAGTVLGTPLQINRATGLVTIGSGNLQVNGGATVGTNTAAATLLLNGPAASNRTIYFETAGSARWMMFANNTAEGGSNAGSDFQINAVSDAGGFLATPLQITRATGLVTLNNGLSFGSAVAPGGVTDVSRHLALYGNNNGMNITAGFMNLVASGTAILQLSGTGATINGNVGFHSTPAIAKPTVTGAKGGNTALASFLTAMAAYGLITDSSTA